MLFFLSQNYSSECKTNFITVIVFSKSFKILSCGVTIPALNKEIIKICFFYTEVSFQKSFLVTRDIGWSYLDIFYPGFGPDRREGAWPSPNVIQFHFLSLPGMGERDFVSS